MTNKELLIKRIIYRSTHRGTKEMDLLLGSFVKNNISKFNINTLLDLEKLLSLEDEVLSKWYFENLDNKSIFKAKVSLLLKKYKP